MRDIKVYPVQEAEFDNMREALSAVRFFVIGGLIGSIGVGAIAVLTKPFSELHTLYAYAAITAGLLILLATCHTVVAVNRMKRKLDRIQSETRFTSKAGCNA